MFLKRRGGGQPQRWWMILGLVTVMVSHCNGGDTVGWRIGSGHLISLVTEY
jgi:hypothetical protein